MITQELVKQLFNYDPETGILTWRIRPCQCVQIGDEAGHYNKYTGYYQVTIKYKNYITHRIIFLWFHGYLPVEVDHIDENKINNKIKNLRACNHSENQRNSGIQKNNTSGIKGVSWSESRKKWVVSISFNGKQKSLGRFEDIEDARKKITSARELYHGEFANHGVSND